MFQTRCGDNLAMLKTQKQSSQAGDPQKNPFLKLVYSPQMERGRPPTARFHFYHPHLTGTQTHNASFIYLFFISGSQWKDKPVSWVFFHVWARWAALPFLWCCRGSSSRTANLQNSLRSKAPSEVWLDVHPLLTLQSPMATKLIWYKFMKNNEMITTTWHE